MAEAKEKLPLIITNLDKLRMPKRKCAYCGERKDKEIMVITPLQAFCNRDHAAKYAYNNKDKGADKIHREKKKRLKDNDRSIRTREAQKAFNAYIRYRDRDLNCISCNRSDFEVNETDGWKIGGAWDCGHFLTVGGFPELRFEELNANRQCKSCNAGSDKYAKKTRSVARDYRINLIKKIGLEKVEWLEGPHEPKKYTCEELKEIELTYKQKLKDLKNVL